LRLVLDTNVLLVSVSSKSRYHWLFEAILNEEIDVLVTNDILLEYEEVIARHWNETVARGVIQTILLSENVYKVDVFYQWGLIDNDPDDNKFVDCAIAGGAEFLVTEDKDYRILDQIDFPKVHRLSVDELKQELRKKTG
jgi:uncharacterized protein